MINNKSSTEERSEESEEETTYVQHNGIKMERKENVVYPRFYFENNPGMRKLPSKKIGYPLKSIPVSDDSDYIYPGEPQLFPEMDFRSLANDLSDGKHIPNTTYLTHSIHKHPAIFIPQIPSYIIRQFTDVKNESGNRPIILDPFSGSGTTGIEAKINGRDYVGIELNPLSKLVSEVATRVIPPSLLKRAQRKLIELINDLDKQKYNDFDVEFLDGTNKNHWFEQEAIVDLTRIRKALSEFRDEPLELEDMTNHEQKVVDDLGLDYDELHNRIYRWLILMVANTVFKVSNADPGVSKAYKSKKMRQKINKGEHPPDVIEVHKKELYKSRQKLNSLWKEIYDDSHPSQVGQSKLHNFKEDKGNNEKCEETKLSNNQAHKAEVDIRLGDTRDFDFQKYKKKVDLAVTSPPYISAMNYYRGTKLRLFWIYDLLTEDEKIDSKYLRKSIIGSNSISKSNIDKDKPLSLRSRWLGSEKEFDETRIPFLDKTIEAIYNSDYKTSEKKAYVTWKFFAKDMLKSLTRVFEHLKLGGYFFFLIGENTICENLVHSHKFIEDIARNLGKFEGHEGNLGKDEGYRVIGSAWDEITNRDLFQDRNHKGGVINCEWMVMLQKPKG